MKSPNLLDSPAIPPFLKSPLDRKNEREKVVDNTNLKLQVEPSSKIAIPQEIIHDNQILAIILPAEFRQTGIHFLTPDSFSQQLAYMNHPKGKSIAPHVHNLVHREVFHTQEVLFIKRGKLRVDFYTQQQQYVESRILKSGDVILLVSGGHGFEILEEVEMIEVKQGPYVGSQDKIRFVGISPARLRIQE